MNILSTKTIRITGILAFLMSGSFMTVNCDFYTMKISERRKPVDRSIQISPDVKITPTGEVYVSVAGLLNGDLVPASFRIDYRDQVIYIDPVLVDNPTRADYIFITHHHEDHLSRTDIEKLADGDTVIVGPESVVEKLKNYYVRLIRPGDNIQFPQFSCTGIPAYNLDSGIFAFTVHRKSEKNVGYVLDFGTTRIFHAGDSDFVPEMNQLKDITVALLPIGVGPTAMSPDEAALAVKTIKPDMVIPMHYDPGENNLLQFKKFVPDDVRMIPVESNNFIKQSSDPLQ